MQKNLGISYELKLPLILIHTPFGLKFFDKIANSKFGKIYAKFNIYLMPLITALAVFLIVGSLLVIFYNDSAREGVREIGPQGNLLIPGLNPILPWTYGWIGLVVTIIIHEAGHGIVARVYNTKVESTGVVLFLVIPIGAFVNIQQDELNRTSFKQKSAILTAGPMNNMILAGICFGLLFLLVSSLSPISNSSADEPGITVLTVGENSLAQSIGLEKDSIITFINNEPIEDVVELRNILRDNLGTSIQIKWLTEDKREQLQSVNLPASLPENKGVLGVTLADTFFDPVLVLDRYKNLFLTNPLAILMPPTLGQSAIPYSDVMSSQYSSSIFGPAFPIIGNLLFWIWFINFNVGIFNALPITMLDGGQWYGTLLENKIKTKSKIKPFTILSIIFIIIVILAFSLPWVLA
ncbi:MAG TPA: site-2 protease family protein [Nitrososphaeraceae archaeon]|nr:site-2 protease family protein [Nitrososphaeraceae archaeon]